MAKSWTWWARLAMKSWTWWARLAMTSSQRWVIRGALWGAILEQCTPTSLPMTQCPRAPKGLAPAPVLMYLALRRCPRAALEQTLAHNRCPRALVETLAHNRCPRALVETLARNRRPWAVKTLAHNRCPRGLVVKLAHNRCHRAQLPLQVCLLHKTVLVACAALCHARLIRLRALLLALWWQNLLTTAVLMLWWRRLLTTAVVVLWCWRLRTNAIQIQEVPFQKK